MPKREDSVGMDFGQFAKQALEELLETVARAPRSQTVQVTRVFEVGGGLLLKLQISSEPDLRLTVD